MGVTIDNQRTASEKLTGLGQFTVVGFNLSKKELAELGINYKNEPVYLSTRKVKIGEGDTATEIEVPVARICAYVRLETEVVNKQFLNIETGNVETTIVKNPIKGKVFPVYFNIEDRPFTSLAKGTSQFLNGVAKSRWAAQPQDLEDWFKVKSPVYPALRGLSSLYDFIISWTNIDTSKADSSVMLGDSPEAIRSIFEDGNTEIVDELNGYAQALQGNMVTMLMGVEGEYMNLFGGVILGESFTDKDKTRMYEQATGTYGFKADFQDSLDARVFDPVLSNLLSGSGNNNASSPTPSAVTPDVVGDLPF